MSSDMHDLLSRMADELDNYRQLLTDDRREVHALAAEARAALAAAPVREGPSDEELYDLAELFNGDPVPAMRRALELWGRPATPPTPLEGEVGELVAELRDAAFDLNGSDPAKSMLTRAAALLEQYQGSVKSAPSLTIAPAPPVVPIPVSERLPGGWDCDAGGSCWTWTADDVDGVGHWFYSHRDWAQEGDVTHWLPAHALPLPAPQGGEVEG